MQEAGLSLNLHDKLCVLHGSRATQTVDVHKETTEDLKGRREQNDLMWSENGLGVYHPKPYGH